MIKLICSPANGSIFCDGFVVIKPSSSYHIAGENAEIMISGHNAGIAIIKSVTTMPISKITETLALAVGGCSADEMQRNIAVHYDMSYSDKVDVIGVKYVQKNLDVHRVLLTMRWDDICALDPTVNAAIALMPPLKMAI